MATIKASSATSIFTLDKWLGLNEAPDGDTGMKIGEAAVMRNWRITQENHLQIRPGYAELCTMAENSPVRGLWSGYVEGQRHLLAACGGHLWDIDRESWEKTDLGEIEDRPVSFFGFSKKVYILTGAEYYSWDGTGTVVPVEGYIPVISTATPPTGGGVQLDRVNLLTGKKRAEYSPDGTATEFFLPETNVDEILSVEGTEITWTADNAAGKVTFASAPVQGINTITITWRKGDGQRGKVIGMRFAENYNGSTDSRVFLYGNGTNQAVYSGLDDNGQPSAEYFPDLNVISVDSANTPITGMVRHYDRLMVYKSDSTHSVSYDTITLDGGLVTAAFFVKSVNREIGNSAPGQVRLVENDPRTLFGKSVYEWALSASGVRDERNAKRISDRVEATLSRFKGEECLIYDDERQREYYICCGDEALVHNYGSDTWYYYDHFPVRGMVMVDGEVYFGTPDGRVMHLSREYRNDDLQDIDAYWESGSLDFDRDWRRKYSSTIWVSIKPESQGRVTVTVQSNRKSDYAEKVVSSGLATFSHTSFAHWSFNTNRKPQVQRVKLKVKKFTFYKLIFTSVSSSATATVLAADIQVRYTGNVK